MVEGEALAQLVGSKKKGGVVVHGWILAKVISARHACFVTRGRRREGKAELCEQWKKEGE